MPRFPLITDANDRHRTFIIVVAWFFTLLGTYDALKTLNRLIPSHWTLAYSSLGGAYALTQVAELLFSVAAAIVGLGMLNQRATALRNGTYLLWLYFLWTVGMIAWVIIEFVERTARMARLATDAPEVAEIAFQSGLATFVYSLVSGVVTCVVCVWLAQRLSRPIIKATYAA